MTNGFQLRRYWIRVHSRVGATGTDGATDPSGWESLEYRRQPFTWNGSNLTCGEVIPPDNTFLYPTDGSVANRTVIGTTCEKSTSGYGSGDPLACGTAFDPKGIKSVEYVFRRKGVGQSCWYGSWGTNCMYRKAAMNAAANRWAIPGDNKDPYKNSADYTYVLSVKITNNAGFVSEESITFTETP